ncbi:N-acetylmuramoyl-L-alanine amidase [Erysipelotrichaceae bacterium HCN-30851]
MQKNFVQRHILFFSIIVFCFVFVPIVKNAYAQEKEINKEKIVIKEQEQQKQKEVIKEDRPIVVLDAGHGGYDDGSVSDSKVKEKNITLAITLKLGKILEENDVEVVYTRTNDDVSWPSDNVADLLARSEIANEAEADYFVSIHLNYSEVSQNEVQGSEIWVRRSDSESEKLAVNVNKQLEALDGIVSRGLKDEAESPLSVIEYNNMPSILIETGFLSNENDTKYLTNDKNQSEMANAIAQGILETLK